MLTSTSLSTASTLAYELAKKGIRLKAKDNSYLLALTNSLPIKNQLDAPIPPDAAINILDGIISDIPKEVCMSHDSTQDIVIDELVKLVPKHLNFVKNQAVPAISETMETTFKMFDSLIGKDPTIDFNIIEVKPYDYLFSSDIQSTASQYKGMTELKVDKDYNLIFDSYYPNNNDGSESQQLLNEVTESMMTQYSNRAIDGLDEMITSANVKSLIESFIYNGFNSSLLFTSDPISTVNAKLLSLMLIDTLSANPSLAKKCTGLTENKFDQFKEQAYRFLLPSIEKFINNYNLNLSNDATKTLILTMDKAKKTVTVDSKIYQQYLSEGGSVEAIFGLLLAEKINYSLYMYQAMLTNTSRLTETYREYVGMYSLYTNTELLNHFKVHFDQIVTGFIQSAPTEVEKDFYSKNNRALESVRKILKEELSKLTTDSVKDKEAIYHTGSMIIAKSRFYFTPAYFILDTMNKAAAQGNSDASSAATVAIIYYLTDFFFTQIKY